MQFEQIGVQVLSMEDPPLHSRWVASCLRESESILHENPDLLDAIGQVVDFTPFRSSMDAIVIALQPHLRIAMDNFYAGNGPPLSDHWWWWLVPMVTDERVASDLRLLLPLDENERCDHIVQKWFEGRARGANDAGDQDAGAQDAPRANTAPSLPSEIDKSDVPGFVESAAAALGRHTGRAVRTILTADQNFGCVLVDGDDKLSIYVRRYWPARKEIAVDVTADVEWLIDGALATWGSFGDEYANAKLMSVDAAIEWVTLNCRAAPVARVSPDEFKEWERTTVSVRDPKDKSKVVSVWLSVAVKKMFGPRYSFATSASALMANEGINESDAAVIAAAIWKMLPKRSSR